MPGWKNRVGRRRTLILRTVAGVGKAVKWTSPSRAIKGQRWFDSFHTCADDAAVAFFRGA